MVGLAKSLETIKWNPFILWVGGVWGRWYPLLRITWEIMAEQESLLLGIYVDGQNPSSRSHLISLDQFYPNEQA